MWVGAATTHNRPEASSGDMAPTCDDVKHDCQKPLFIHHLSTRAQAYWLISIAVATTPQPNKQRPPSYRHKLNCLRLMPMEQINTGPSKHLPLLGRDYRLSYLWKGLQELRSATGSDSSHTSVEEKKALLEQIQDAVERCLGHMKWKQRKWLIGGISALRNMSMEDWVRQKEEGSLICDLVAHKAQVIKEIQELDALGTESGHGKVQECVSGLIHPGGSATADGNTKAKNKDQDPTGHARQRRAGRPDMRRITKPRHRWLLSKDSARRASRRRNATRGESCQSPTRPAETSP